MADLVYFHDDHIQLVKEIRANKELYNIILEAQPADMAEALGHICAYCNIVIDGVYTQQEIDDLIEELVVILRKKQTITVGSVV